MLFLITFLNFFLCIACGLSAKLTDFLVDDYPRVLVGAKYAAGVVYGIIAGFLFSLSWPLATVITAIVVANLLRGKVDDLAHVLAVIAIVCVVGVLGFPGINLVFLAIIFLAALADEHFNNWSDRAHKKNFLTEFVRLRLTTDLAVFAIAIYSGQLEFLYLFGFDAGYQVGTKYLPQLFSLFSIAPSKPNKG